MGDVLNGGMEPPSRPRGRKGGVSQPLLEPLTVSAIGKACPLLCALLVLAMTGAAAAEVCDKERPGWSRADGPVGQLGETFFTFTTTPGIVLVALLAISLLIRVRWLFVLNAVMTFLFGFALALNWIDMHEITRAAVAEGCVTAPVLPVAILAALFVLMTYRAVRPRSMLRWQG